MLSGKAEGRRAITADERTSDQPSEPDLRAGPETEAGWISQKQLSHKRKHFFSENVPFRGKNRRFTIINAYYIRLMITSDEDRTGI